MWGVIMTRISVHIATLNRPNNLAVLLSSFLRQTFKDWDLIIVDDSKVPSKNYAMVACLLKQIQEDGHKLTYIPNPSPVGVGRARNIAIEHDKNKYGLRIDDDSWCEPDYFERLHDLITSYDKIGAAGGTVPYMKSFIGDKILHPDRLNGVFNKIVFDVENKFVDTLDDATFHYQPNAILPSHHIRSSFMFNNKVARKVGMHPTNLGPTGFREETVFTMKIAWAGHELWTDTSAICWHFANPAGGVRNQLSEGKSNVNFHNQMYTVCNNWFMDWAIRNYLEKGNPYRGWADA